MNKYFHILKRRSEKSLFPQEYPFFVILIFLFLLCISIWSLWRQILANSLFTITTQPIILIILVLVAPIFILHAIYTPMMSEKIMSILIILYCFSSLVQNSIEFDKAIYYLSVTKYVIIILIFIIVNKCEVK